MEVVLDNMYDSLSLPMKKKVMGYVSKLYKRSVADSDKGLLTDEIQKMVEFSRVLPHATCHESWTREDMHRG